MYRSLGSGVCPKNEAATPKFLPEHFVRRMLEPVGDQEGIVFVEVAIIKDQKEFAAVRTEPLNGVRECPLENTRDRRRQHRRRSCVPFASTAVIRAVP